MKPCNIDINVMSFLQLMLVHNVRKNTHFSPNKIYIRLKWNICVVPVAYLPYVFNPTLNIKMVFGEKIPKMGTFSGLVTIFFVKCYNKI